MLWSIRLSAGSSQAKQSSDKLHTDHDSIRAHAFLCWRCEYVHIFCEAARGLNGFGSPGCFRGRGNCDCTSHHRSDPVTGFALEGDVSVDPSGKIVAMAARRHNELMNHSDTPRLKPISDSVRAQREGGHDGGGVGARTS